MKQAAFLIGSAVIAAVALTGCQPPARSVSEFKAHPQAAAQVAADCSAGAHGGPECDNARAAAAEIESAKRLRLFKQGFDANPKGSSDGR